MHSIIGSKNWDQIVLPILQLPNTPTLQIPINQQKLLKNLPPHKTRYSFPNKTQAKRSSPPKEFTRIVVGIPSTNDL